MAGPIEKIPYLCIEKKLLKNLKVRKKIEFYYRNIAGDVGFTGGCVGLHFVRIAGGRAAEGLFKPQFDRHTPGAGSF